MARATFAFPESSDYEEIERLRDELARKDEEILRLKFVVGDLERRNKKLKERLIDARDHN